MQTRKIGRPLKFESPEQLIEAINAYFVETNIEELTLTGLCLAIGTNKVVLNDYEKRDEYADIVKEAKMIVENAYELSLRKHGRSGDIFALKNFGWQDKSEVKQDNTTVMIPVDTENMSDEERSKLLKQRLGF